jgi:hypothetical protein
VRRLGGRSGPSPAQGGLAYGQAAPFALLMIAIAAVPSYVLGRFFHRLPARAMRT